MKEYTEKIENQTLSFYAILEIVLGMWMIFSPYSISNFIRVVDIYYPLWILSSIFIIGGLINILLRHKHFYLYVLLTCTPLVFLGIIFAQAALISNVFTSNVILCNFVGIYSAIRAGQIFRRKKINAIK